MESRWGLFADGGAAFGSQNSTVNQTGYSFTLVSLAYSSLWVNGFTEGGAGALNLKVDPAARRLNANRGGRQAVGAAEGEIRQGGSPALRHLPTRVCRRHPGR